MAAIARLLLLTAVALSAANATAIPIIVNTTTWVADTSVYYLSFTMDAGDACGGMYPIVVQPTVVQLAKNLGPGYYRIGGTDADALIFGNVTTDVSGKVAAHPLCHMTPHGWGLAQTFAAQAGWDIVFGLNALQRNPDGSWNSSNAKTLLQYTLDHGYKVAGWELGNEPDLYPGPTFQTTVAPRQMAKDFETLASLVKEVFGPAGANMKLFGPDVASLTIRDWYPQFLSNVSRGVLSDVTVHFYYVNSETATVADYVNATILDTLGTYIESALRSVRQYVPGTRLWLGETSNSYHGGKAGVSDTYAVTPMWIDKLGLSARLGVEGIMRQDYFGGNYGLLSPSLSPTPDYWVSVIFKQLAGTRVLSVRDDLAPGRTVRAYARCALQGSGAVFVMVTNVQSVGVTVTFPNLSTGTRDQYVFSAGTPGNLTSATMQLNGVVLTGTTPSLAPVVVNASAPLVLSPYGSAFVVFSDAAAAVCSQAAAS